MATTPIDAVITWVDGADRTHRAKRATFSAGVANCNDDDIGGNVRYLSSGEILYCVASILRFAPFIHKIFIVTDAQNPRLDDFVARNFPDTTTAIEIVDHRVIFQGYEQHLPTFNSLSIETMLFRIPGLSDRYVYFNDDVFLTAPVSPDDWFDDDGRCVCYGWHYSARLAAFLRAIKPRRNGHRPIGYKDAMLNAARLIPTRRMLHLHHTPQPQLRQLHERFALEHPDILNRNIRFRFRDGSQYNPQELNYLLAESLDLCTVCDPRRLTLFLKPTATRKGYIARRLQHADRNPELMFGCINSLGEAPEPDRRAFDAWIRQRIRLL